MINTVKQVAADIAITTVILVLGTVAFIVVSPFILAAYIRNHRTVKHKVD